MDPAILKTELQSLGLRVRAETGEVRRGGAGPAEGLVLLLDETVMTVPTHSPFVATSPYSFGSEIDGTVEILRSGKPIALAERRPSPTFYGRRTPQGVPYWKIALLHGRDCVASTVLQGCAFWGTAEGCRFCGIGLSLEAGLTTASKSADDLASVLAAAGREGVAGHLVLTSGSTRAVEPELVALADCTRAIRRTCAVPIQVQVLPPADPARLAVLRDAGVDTVGIHIETFDEDVLRHTAPIKAQLGLARFEAAWKEAVRLFGPNQVSSFLIAGLGERTGALLEGASRLASLGVYPFVLPLRPIPGTPLGTMRPPLPEAMASLYQAVAQLLAANELSWRRAKAGCVRCRACSALPDFETG